MRETWDEIDFELGSIQGEYKDERLPSIKFDRAAVSQNSVLYAISIIAGSTLSKQFAALLRKGEKGFLMQMSNVRLVKTWDSNSYGRYPGRVYSDPAGYHTYIVRLDYNQFHTLFLSRSPEFMPVLGEEALYRKLKEDRFNTPMLREWTPYMEQALRKDNRLVGCQCYRCECAELTLTPARFDRFISEGIKAKKIAIPDPPSKTVPVETASGETGLQIAI